MPGALEEGEHAVAPRPRYPASSVRVKGASILFSKRLAQSDAGQRFLQQMAATYGLRVKGGRPAPLRLRSAVDLNAVVNGVTALPWPTIRWSPTTLSFATASGTQKRA